MLRYYLFLLFFASLLTSCHASSESQKTSNVAKVDSIPQIKPTHKFEFEFTSSGLGAKPSDAMKLDSNRLLTYSTRFKDSLNNWTSRTGMADLETPDFGPLAAIVNEEDIFSIDPADVSNTDCPKGEFFVLTLRQNGTGKTLHLEYTSCSIEYNLLTGEQRENFTKLYKALEAIRAKYRPGRPEE